ncbi:MAG: OmpA family protein [Hyphomicrobiales bacterium]
MKVFCALALFCPFLSACAAPKVDGPVIIGNKAPPTMKIVHKPASRTVALESAGVKALTPENTSAYMDNQAREIGKRLEFNKDFRLARNAYDIVIVAQSEFAFKEDGLQLSVDFEAAMKHLSSVMITFDRTAITITGHTDSNGSEHFNQSVSEFRADAISDALRSNGVLAMRIRTAGEGEALPAASNKSSKGRSRNNRMEIRVSPIT